MARPKKSAAQEEAKAGHNSGVSDDDRKVLFFMDRNAYVKALAAKKAADAELKNVCKTIKADLGANGVAQIKLYELCRTPEGEAKVKAEELARREAMRWAGIPINTQADLFADLAPLDERALEDGEEAGLRGDTLANPYDENSTAGRRFADGWKAGQAKLGEGIKQKAMATADERIAGSDEDEDPFGEEDEFDAADPSKVAAE
jgi:hypothetical protein